MSCNFVAFFSGWNNTQIVTNIFAILHVCLLIMSILHAQAIGSAHTDG